jgi:hypothetical protein
MRQPSILGSHPGRGNEDLVLCYKQQHRGRAWTSSPANLAHRLAGRSALDDVAHSRIVQVALIWTRSGSMYGHVQQAKPRRAVVDNVSPTDRCCSRDRRTRAQADRRPQKPSRRSSDDADRRHPSEASHAPELKGKAGIIASVVLDGTADDLTRRSRKRRIRRSGRRYGEPSARLVQEVSSGNSARPTDYQPVGKPIETGEALTEPGRDRRVPLTLTPDTFVGRR